jgi:hypothetical protein
MNFTLAFEIETRLRQLRCQALQVSLGISQEKEVYLEITSGKFTIRLFDSGKATVKRFISKTKVPHPAR